MLARARFRMGITILQQRSPHPALECHQIDRALHNSLPVRQRAGPSSLVAGVTALSGGVNIAGVTGTGRRSASVFGAPPFLFFGRIE